MTWLGLKPRDWIISLVVVCLTVICVSAIAAWSEIEQKKLQIIEDEVRPRKLWEKEVERE